MALTYFIKLYTSRADKKMPKSLKNLKNIFDALLFYSSYSLSTAVIEYAPVCVFACLCV